jgi:digeranylgeranylglycerophospholipid reductase
MRKINCDVVVVGAGPGGSMAAKTCAKFGLDTVLIDRKSVIGKPNCMSCQVSRSIYDRVRIDEKFVVPLYIYTLHSPDGTELTTKEW